MFSILLGLHLGPEPYQHLLIKIILLEKNLALFLLHLFIRS